MEVRILFRDHRRNADESESYLVYGRIFKVTDEAIVLDSWAQPDVDALRDLGNEVECFCILRRVIESIDVADWRPL